ncbi:hypothetical protein D3C73_1521960 [compost metagenome]
MQRNTLQNLPADLSRVIGAAIVNDNGLVDVLAVHLQNLPQEALAFIFDHHG